MSQAPDFNDRNLSLGLARVSEAAAIACTALIGRGDEKAADQAAVDAMRTQLNKLDIAGVVVIGEGERDEAPMLYIGEEVGTGTGPGVDIALDPLEGTTLTAKDMPNALACIAMGPRGSMLHAPDVYMDKLAIGPGFRPGVVTLDMGPAERVSALAAAKGCSTNDITVCVLERPRHEDMIAEIRSTGAAIRLITDGDVAGVMHCAEPDLTGIDRRALALQAKRVANAQKAAVRELKQAGKTLGIDELPFEILAAAKDAATHPALQAPLPGGGLEAAVPDGAMEAISYLAGMDVPVKAEPLTEENLALRAELEAVEVEAASRTLAPVEDPDDWYYQIWKYKTHGVGAVPSEEDEKRWGRVQQTSERRRLERLAEGWWDLQFGEDCEAM